MLFSAETLLIQPADHALHVTFNRPDVRNAMNASMVEELIALFEQLPHHPAVRAVVLRGAGGHFCAGGDIRDMAAARSQPGGMAKLNRRYGQMLQIANRIPSVLVCVLEGAVMGGGFGLACVSDIAILDESAAFGLPETSLGILPAQIAPFVIQRIGLTQTRRLALTGERLTAHQAVNIGLGHYLEAAEKLDSRLQTVLQRIKNCAPQANIATKRLLLDSLTTASFDELLDRAAQEFAEAVTGQEGIEGASAFIQKRPPDWAK